MFKTRSKLGLRAALLALAAPVIGLSASVNLTGPVVDFNSAYDVTSFNQTVTLADGDVYNVSGSYFASYTAAGGTSISIDPVIKYLGSSATATNDAISISFTQAFFDTRTGVWDGHYTSSTPVNIMGSVGAGSSLTAEVLYDGQSLGAMTGSSGVLTSAADLTGLTGDTLTASYDLTYDLNAGTEPGASISSSSVPEPVEALPVGVGLMGILYIAARRLKS
jgi:hypothetical protein